MRADTEHLLAELFADAPTVRGRAFTRKAWLAENGRQAGPCDHHETLEFLGDAWLGAIVSTQLMRMFPSADEHQLSATRDSLVDRGTLAEIARDHEVHTEVLAGRGELAQAQHLTDRSLASLVEALIGASYEAGGLAAAERLVGHFFAARWPSAPFNTKPGNCKGKLQELEQKSWGSPPSYDWEELPRTTEAPVRFRSTVNLGDGRTFEGAWRDTKKEAEQAAAQAALRDLQG